MSLFRKEVIDHQRKRLFGRVTIHQPPTFAAYTLLIACGTIIGFIFLATGTYARREAVSGWISPQQGLVLVYATRPGIARPVDVKLGDPVTAGTPLVHFLTDVTGPGGSLTAEQHALTVAKIHEVNLQVDVASHGKEIEQAKERTRRESLVREQEELRAERTILLQQLAVDEEQVARIAPLAETGFVSKTIRDQRTLTMLQRKQEITHLDGQITSKQSEIDDAEQTIKLLRAEKAVSLSELRATREGLMQALAEVDAQGENIIRAPVSGVVAAVNLRTGDSADVSVPIFAIAPQSRNLEAEVWVPSRAMGFIARGQEVRIEIDAFPSQRFGGIVGKVEAVSRAPVRSGQMPFTHENKEPVYRVAVSLPLSAIHAYGGDHDLRPGMTLKAYVILSKRTFLQWLIDPLISRL